MNFKIFVSYSTLDLENVYQLKQEIKNTGIEVFIAEHSLKAGAKLSESITAQIDKCDLFIILWSKNAKASEWVSQEIGIAHAKNKHILPLVLTENLKLPGFINDLKYISVFKNPEKANQETRDIILEHLQSKLANDKKVLIAVGVFLIWALTQK